MSSTEEKRYYIDPGIGKKRSNCPYSCYEDGRDVKEDIIPPKGYVLSGFKFDSNSPNNNYDGRLIAQYEKSAFSTRLKQNLSIYVLFVLMIIVALIILSTLDIFPKSKHKVKPVKTITTITQESTSKSTTTPSDNQTTFDSKNVSNSTEVGSTTTMEQAEQKVIIPDVKDEVTSTSQNKDLNQTQEIKTDDVTAQFNQELWKLIHNRNVQMDTYFNLYESYKGKVKGKEYNYLRLTILKNTAEFKKWKNKLLGIPDSDLQSINTIDALEQRIKQSEYQ